MKALRIAPLFAAGLLAAVASTPALTGAPAEEEAVRAVIDRLFDGMRAGDSAAVRATFAPKMRLLTVAPGADGATQVQATPAAAFVAAVGAEREAVWDERIWDVEIRRDGPLAAAWVPYAFYTSGLLSHCGTNAFQLARVEAGWQIVQITDTRRADCDAFVPGDVQAGGQP